MVGLIVGLVLVLFALFVAAKTVRIIPQARAGVVERLGPLQPHADAGHDDRRALHRSRAPAVGPA